MVFWHGVCKTTAVSNQMQVEAEKGKRQPICSLHGMRDNPFKQPKKSSSSAIAQTTDF